MRKIQLLTILFAASAIIACSKNNDLSDREDDPTAQNTTEAFATFTIQVPKSSKTTKATDPGTANETAVKTLHVFIYDSVSPHTATVANFSTTDNTLIASSNGWKTKTPIKTLKADKYIFVGVNLTTDIVNEILSKGFGAFNYKEFAQSVSDLTSSANGFVMFNATYPVLTPADALANSIEEAQNNSISISVSRVIAKAAVFKSQYFVVNGGGEMQNITYGWRNINKQFYFIQQVVNGVIMDYNWDSYSINDFVRGTDTIPVNEYTNTAPTQFSYALENTFNYIQGTSKVDQSTFLSIRGQFRPDQIIQVKSSVSTPQTSNDFEIVNNPNGYGTFYVVRTDDAISNYFINGTQAQQYADLCILGATGMPKLTGPYTLANNTYPNGLCYFHVLLNSSAVKPYTPYGIYRNQYYKLTLNSIQAPGNPNDNFDQNQIISPNTWVDVNITINEWEIVNEDQDL